ncbi:MAG: thymidine kinase [Clostridia bacterium]|nr:thymidine kinase [Clostridia bacterium]
MAKLYFKYGAMGSSKTAQVLITKFNYEERGMRVWLIKPATDVRDGEDVIRSRIGLESKCLSVGKKEDIYTLFTEKHSDADVIICDESQFFTARQIDQLRKIADVLEKPVLCFGLRTDFMTRLFPGSLRLFEVADTISEIKTMCECGRKATVNARIDDGGNVLTEGRQVMLGGNERYVAMCHSCWRKRIGDEE